MTNSFDAQPDNAFSTNAARTERGAALHASSPDDNLYMLGISKSFNGVAALHSVSFTASSGEIHALLGANGAGKSTLMKILSGAYRADVGNIHIGSRPLQIKSPADAKRQGIHCVYQEVDTALVPQLTVAENIMMDRMGQANRSWWVSPRRIRQEAEKAMQSLGAAIPLTKRVEQCTLAEKQMVLLARILAEQAKVVIFDEPTAPLSHEEAMRLFQMMRSMRDLGVVVIFISHRLPEVFAESDRITIMRDGQIVHSSQTDETTPEEVVRHMLGKTFEEEFPKEQAVIGDVLLQVQGITRGRKVRDVSFDVRQGEIVGIVGVVGAGKTELSRLLTGVDVYERGSMSLNGVPLIPKEPADAVRAGIVLVPEERRKQGVFVQESIQHNISVPLLKALSLLGFVRKRNEWCLAEQMRDRLTIKSSSVKQEVKYLSGGNQQKVSIGKWLETPAYVYVLDEPTKGVDIGAKSDMFRIIGKLVQQGKGIVYLTCEFNEVIGIADRIYVMYDGELVQAFQRNEVTQEQLMFYASAGQGGEWK